MSFARSASNRKLALPAAGGWAGKATDSIGDDAFALGQWYDQVCTHFGWNQINSNMLGNGSAEVDLTGWSGESLPAGATMTRDSARAAAGTWSVKLAGPTSGAAAQTYYVNVGGAAPGTIGVTLTSGAITALSAGLTGGDYIANTLASAGGGGTTQGTYALATGPAGAIQGVLVQTGGAGYTGPPTFSITDPFGAGTGANFTATLSGGAITAVTVNSGGGGYAAGTTLKVRGGGATIDAVLTPTIVAGVITAVVVNSGGTTYATQPTFTADCSGGGAALNATIVSNAVSTVAVSAAGAGLYASPTVVIQGATGGSGGAIRAYIDANGLARGGVIATAGSGYTGTLTGIVTRMAPASRSYNNQGVVAGGAYTLNAQVWTGGAGGSPAGPPIANIFVQILSVDATTGTTTVVTTASGAGSLSAWVNIAAAFTVPANSAAVYYRIGATTSALNQSFWVDAVQLCKGLNVSPPVYTDFTERGGISGCTITDYTAANMGLPANRTPVGPTPAIQAGGVVLGSGTTTTGSGGTASLQTTYATRITRHTTMGILFIECGINDLATMSSAFGVTGVTLANMTTALNTILAAVAAMSSPPIVVIVGLLNFGTANMNASPPTGYPNYYQAADDVDRVLKSFANNNRVVYVPIRPRMHESMVSLNGPHPVVPLGTNFVAQCIIDALEQGTV